MQSFLAAESLAVEKYLTLSRGTMGLARANLLDTVLSDPLVFTFTPFLNLTEQNSPQKSVFSVFLSGQWKDLPHNISLHQTAARKLKLLTIIELSRGRISVPYNEIASECSLNNDAEIEELFTEGLSIGVFSGRMDTLNRCVIVSNAIGRDISGIDEVKAILNDVKIWRQKITTAVEELDGVIERGNTEYQKEKERVSNSQKEKVKAEAEAAEARQKKGGKEKDSLWDSAEYAEEKGLRKRAR